ncbi:MAG: hypothetical protein AAGL98_06015 [Planctomycetota bacterium]
MRSFRRDHLTDEQYIEEIRKSQRLNRWVRGALFTSAALMVGVGLMAALPTLTHVISRGILPPAVIGGLAIGISMGFVFAGFLGVGMHHLASAFFETRKDRLLLRLWDELHVKADNPEPSP